jgi:predicted phosphodiesterase
MDIIEQILSLHKETQTEPSMIVESHMTKPKKIVVLPDIHYPMHINLSAIEKFLVDYKPDVLIYLGDLMDLDYLSRFQKENKLIIGNNLRREYNEVIKLIEKHRSFSGAEEVYYIEGNHEYRVQKFLESYPAGTGFIEIPVAMGLKERGIKWVELNDWVRIGHLFFYPWFVL